MRAVAALALLAVAACSSPPAVTEGAARLRWSEARTLVSASAFAILDGQLYLADSREAVVERLEQDGSGVWQRRRIIGRKGGGPSEFEPPLTIAAIAPKRQLVVLDQSGHLRRFSADGALIDRIRLAFPCRIGLSQLTVVDTAVFVSGRCHRINGHAADTVYMVLWQVGRDGSLRAQRWRPLYTRDGRWGTLYGAVKPTAESRNSLFFGTGVTPCIDPVVAVPKLPARCFSLERFRSDAPRGFNRRGVDRVARWPSPLPAFVGMVTNGREILLVRPFSADSIAVQHAATRTITHVAPLDSFLGCRDGRCLWLESTAAGSRIALLEF